MLQNKVLSQELFWCAVPVFNNKKTVRQVVSECREVISNVVVVDDGSRDADVAALISTLMSLC